jgi:hypothetical protein
MRLIQSTELPLNGRTFQSQGCLLCASNKSFLDGHIFYRLNTNALLLVSGSGYFQLMGSIRKPLFLFGLVLVLLLGIPLPVASAAVWTQYQSSPVDTYNRPDLPVAYDITSVDFAVSDSDPTRYDFFLIFAKPVSANLFSDGLTSWAGILIDTNGDGKDDYSLETDTRTPYSGNYSHAGTFSDRTSGSPVNSSLCDVKTWSDLDHQVAWIGFSIPKTCLPFGTNISVQGYSDHNSSDNAEFDNAPDSPWTLSLSGGTVSPTPGNSSSSNSAAELPTVSAAGAGSISSPSNPPDDLVNLAATVTRSVVTVLCGNSLGSGWAINVQLSSSLTNAGYKTYLITNHHVIADCTTARNITVILADQTKVSAYVWSWDETNDVAGIATTTHIPVLNWRGATPEQGWWAGIIGSPLGFPGILTTGIISSNNASTFLGTTTAPINHGNSGGPVFDRMGRVIGLATAKYIDSEGFGIFHGTPLLCGKIVNCANPSQVWSGVITPTPTPTPTPDSVESLEIDATFSFSQGKVGLSTLVWSAGSLPIHVSAISEATCVWGGGIWIFFLKPGTCSFTANTDGSSNLSASSPVHISFKITKPAPKPVTIICVKGKLSKKVTAVKPICPTGYKEK